MEYLTMEILIWVLLSTLNIAGFFYLYILFFIMPSIIKENKMGGE